MNQSTEVRHRSMIIVWLALLVSILMYFILTLVAGVRINTSHSGSESWVLVALTAAGMILMLVSFAIKRKFLRRSVDEQNIALVQSGHILAWALCEACALFGLLQWFAFGYRYYYGLLLLGAFGIALQFPRREHLTAATFKDSNKI